MSKSVGISYYLQHNIFATAHNDPVPFFSGHDTDASRGKPRGSASGSAVDKPNRRPIPFHQWSSRGELADQVSCRRLQSTCCAELNRFLRVIRVPAVSTSRNHALSKNLHEPISWRRVRYDLLDFLLSPDHSCHRHDIIEEYSLQRKPRSCSVWRNSGSFYSGVEGSNMARGRRPRYNALLLLLGTHSHTPHKQNCAITNIRVCSNHANSRVYFRCA
mmetsp:Transcript_27261/g.43769  ORF Transcript_27261/g.43769 Transcript_27261/m.43769 type:complete len:217 (+) Transcript_27261:552-1202(+)